MSDTSNQVRLASAEEFDARLRRTDEDRWLATRYAPAPQRQYLIAIYLLHQELQRALRVKEPMLGKIRVQWWRETLEHAAGGATVRRHDLAEELARIAAQRPDLLAAFFALLESFDAVLDEHMHTGHTDSHAHETSHLATERALVRLAAGGLDPDAREEHLEAVADAGASYLGVRAGLAGAEEAWRAARARLHILPACLWPAVLHLAAGPDNRTLSPLAKRWRIFRAVLSRRI